MTILIFWGWGCFGAWIFFFHLQHNPVFLFTYTTKGTLEFTLTLIFFLEKIVSPLCSISFGLGEGVGVEGRGGGWK